MQWITEARVSDAETVSLWQSLAYGPCYKSVYCMAVCPAGDEVIPQYLADKKKFIEDVVKPLRNKEETVYVLPGSDAESHVPRMFPHKKIKRVGNGIRPPTVAFFLAFMPRAFQRHQSEGTERDLSFHVQRQRPDRGNGRHQGQNDSGATRTRGRSRTSGSLLMRQPGCACCIRKAVWSRKSS